MASLDTQMIAPSARLICRTRLSLRFHHDLAEAGAVRNHPLMTSAWARMKIIQGFIASEPETSPRMTAPSARVQPQPGHHRPVARRKGHRTWPSSPTGEIAATAHAPASPTAGSARFGPTHEDRCCAAVNVSVIGRSAFAFDQTSSRWSQICGHHVSGQTVTVHDIMETEP